MKQIPEEERTRLLDICPACNHLEIRRTSEWCEKCGQNVAKKYIAKLCPLCGDELGKWHNPQGCTEELSVIYYGDPPRNFLFEDKDGDLWVARAYMDYDTPAYNLEPIKKDQARFEIRTARDEKLWEAEELDRALQHPMIMSSK